jgi:hypothetical protein
MSWLCTKPPTVRRISKLSRSSNSTAPAAISAKKALVTTLTGIKEISQRQLNDHHQIRGFELPPDLRNSVLRRKVLISQEAHCTKSAKIEERLMGDSESSQAQMPRVRRAIVKEKANLQM